MKFYINLQIICGNKVKDLLSRKYGIGLAILAFNKYYLNFEKNCYFYKNTINEALSNLKKVSNFIKISKQEDSFYDLSNLELISNIEEELSSLYQELEQYKDIEGVSIYADYSEILKLYEKTPEDLNPTDEITESMNYICSVLKGYYFGRHTRKDEIELMASLKYRIMNDLEKSETALNFNSEGYAFEPKMIKIGSRRLIKFLVNVKVQENRLYKYPNPEEYLYEINDIIKKYELGYELEKSATASNKLRNGIIQVWLMKII